MLTFGSLEMLLLAVAMAVVGLSIAALVEISQRAEGDFREQGRSFYVVLLAVGLLLPPLGVLALVRYQLDVRSNTNPDPSQ